MVKENKKIDTVFYRFIKVIYVLFLLFGIALGIHIWKAKLPSCSTYNYSVVCASGKVFDPSSLQIESFAADIVKPYVFDPDLLASECIFGDTLHGNKNDIPEIETVDFIIDSAADPSNPNNVDGMNYKNNIYQISTTPDTNVLALTGVVIGYLFVYYMGLEIIRRTYLYIFQGKNFLTLKPAQKPESTN